MSTTATDDVTFRIEKLAAQNWLNLAKAAKLFPMPLSPATVARFLEKGARGSNAHRIKLRAITTGSRWLTTQQFVEELLVALSIGDEPEVAPAPRTAGQIERAARSCDQLLEAEGL